jgi:hypothetical protein
MRIPSPCALRSVSGHCTEVLAVPVCRKRTVILSIELAVSGDTGAERCVTQQARRADIAGCAVCRRERKRYATLV